MRSLSEVRSQALRLWQRHELLRAELAGEVLFPWSLPLNPPAGRAVLQAHGKIAQAIAEWARAEEQGLFRLIWTEKRLQGAGLQRLPERIVFEQRAEFLRFIGKTQEFAAQITVVERLRNTFPELLDWAGARPAQVVKHLEVFDRLLDVAAWLRQHPLPGCYARELPVPGVDSKFIGAHRKILSTLLDRYLPDAAIVHTPAPDRAAAFEHRYGLRYEQPPLRLRLLDPSISPVPGVTDFTLPRDQFANLQLTIAQLYITENKTNFLAFPDQPQAAVLFGKGYAIDELAQIDWLKALPITYWGDIDTHGFNILNRLRGAWPQTRSLLMDEATLLEHIELCGTEPKPIDIDLPRLTTDELALYRDLLSNRHGHNLRLEQERIPFAALRAALTP